MKQTTLISIPLFLAVTFGTAMRAADHVLVEAESFRSAGGWSLDTAVHRDHASGVAGAEEDGFRARSPSAVPRSGTLQQSRYGVRTTLGRCQLAVSFEEIPVSYGPGSTRSGGIVVI